MKPRVLQPYKILAVAITAGLGCTATARPEPSASAPTSAAATTQAAIATREADPSPAAEQAAADSQDPKLLELRGELGAGRDRAEAQRRQAHFRPLCDSDGYPLVGNVNSKAPSGVQPSAFCADVRATRAGN